MRFVSWRAMRLGRDSGGAWHGEGAVGAVAGWVGGGGKMHGVGVLTTAGRVGS